MGATVPGAEDEAEAGALLGLAGSFEGDVLLARGLLELVHYFGVSRNRLGNNICIRMVILLLRLLVYFILVL